jgi:nicotinate-nucleotide adenylyltransferase
MKTRFEMIDRLYAESKLIKVSNEEMEMSVRMGGQVYTYDLLNYLKKKYEWARFYFVVGGDVLHTIGSWHYV